jgi:acetylornithine deacetylase/succinyl-diaminopimelate desuccinylase-like protein
MSHDLAKEIDWPTVGEAAIEALRTYVRFPTINDPDAAPADEPWRTGDEAPAAEWLAEWLLAEGVDCELVSAAPGRTSLIASLPPAGTDPLQPVTLLSHSDVVPAVRDEWDVDPFAATVRDGYLYGRGSLDIKGLGITQLTAMVLLARHRVPVRRGVVAIVAADEETGGAYGAQWLVNERPELLDTAVVLGEGGYSPADLLPGGRVLHAVSVAEKGYLELELTASGPAHHASMPQPDSAPARLVRALNRVLDKPPAFRITEPTRQLCASLAESAHGLHRALLRRPSVLAKLGSRMLPSNPLVASMFTETCAVTVLDGGYKANVVPGRARAVLSMRLLPGTTAEEAHDRVRRAVADPEVEIRQVMHKAPNSSPFDTVGFDLLTSGLGGFSPILSPGASDARHWRHAGVPAYGWVPFELPVADIHGVHGPNERLSLQSFRDGLRMYYHAVAALATEAQPLGHRNGSGR